MTEIISSLLLVLSSLTGLISNAPANYESLKPVDISTISMADFGEVYDGPGANDGLVLGVAASFPTSLYSVADINPTDPVNNPSHSTRHNQAVAEIVALQTKMGIGASTPIADSIFVGNGSGTSAWSTFATTTRFTAANFVATGSTTLQNFTFVNATGTSATTTNLFSTTASSTNLSFTTGNGGNLTSTGIVRGNNLWADASSTLQNFTYVNATGTSATTTNLFATNASTTNHNIVTANINNLTVGSCTGCGSSADALTLVPRSAIGMVSATSSAILDSNTTMFIGQVVITSPIVVNKITVYLLEDFAGSFTLDMTLYSEDGQTQLFSVTTSAFSAAKQVKSTTVNAVSLEPGIYYFGVNPSTSANNGFPVWDDRNTNMFRTVSGEPVMSGTLTITADTPPATIDPTAITSANQKTVLFRLDN